MNTPELQKVVSIPFTEEEARVTLQLFDAAVRARGLEVAEVVAILAKKINEAFKEPKQEVGPRGETGVNGPPDGSGCRGPAGNAGACAAEGVQSGPVEPYKGPHCSYGSDDPRKL